jgi:CRISPR-associated protein (TIGR03986 family)
MFRLPARNLRDAIPPQHKQQIGLDVADRLFGTIQKDPLRGRVFFTTLTCEQKPAEIRFSRVIQTVLGAPRPTFYPAYLEQPEYSLPEGKLHGGKKNARTWLSPEVRIRGWKRYPVWDAPADQPESIRHEHPIPVRKDNQPNYDVATAFRPLKAGAAFTGSVRFHNLTCKELGALVWALTWGGDPALRHSLGMGKSLGLGSCVIEIDWERSSLLWCGDPSNGCAADVKASESDAGQRRAFLNRCQEDFQGQMDNFTKKQLAMESERKSWLETESMKELLAMANPGNADKLAGHKEFPPLPGFRHIKSLGFVLLRTREILERKSVTNCQTTSGNPQLEGRHLAPADDETSGCD